MPGPERVLNVLAAELDFLNSFVTARHEIDLRALPQQFKSLDRLIRTWGISDDVEREERRRDVPRAALQAIVEEVKPYLSAINSYLGSFSGQRLSESAVALGALAEFVAETDLYLSESRTNN